ncbi:MAG: macro domain-containing protein [Lachnospiraceae bacterium]|nr:macro domain-containing protein [Lachnospiraceae bacterium]
MPFQIIRDDIIRVRADAIVNTANPKPVIGAGTDAAIYHAAGAEELLAARQKIGEIARGEVAATPAFALPARYILHTVGPVWRGGSEGEFAVLASCYRKSLLLARKLGCESIAFPLISSGTYGFPKDQALRIALNEISAFLKEDDAEMQVTLVVYDKRAFQLSEELVSGVRAYIDENYIREKREDWLHYEEMEGYQRRRWDELAESSIPYHSAGSSAPYSMPNMAQNDAAAKSAEKKKPAFHLPKLTGKAKKPSEDPFQLRVGETFQERLFQLMNDRGVEDVEVYKRANLDRKLFSKIRSNRFYKPGKRTAVSLAIALELNLDETVDLLSRAELAFSPSSKFDLIIRYCIEHEIYDMYEINAILFEYDEMLLGA